MLQRISALTLTLAVLALATSCKRPIAEPEGQSAAAPQATPTPDELLRRTAGLYKGVQSLQVDMKQSMHAQMQGQAEDKEMEVSLTMRRPNQLAVRLKNEAEELQVISDGSSLSMCLPELKRYSQEKAPATFDELAKIPVFESPTGSGMFLLKLLVDDPYAAITQGVVSSAYVGKETIGAVPAHHIKLTQKEYDWDIWIAATAEPVVLRVRHDLAKALTAAGQDPQRMKLTATQDYANWKLNVQPSANAFAFIPPAEANKVDGLFALPEKLEGGAKTLLGKPAPEAKAKLLAGGDFGLADACKHGIVMLDFWATWCPPCVTEMPILAEVAGRYRDRGVQFFAVNLGESEDEIRKFLKDQKLDVQVVLDAGQIASNYLVDNIPMLVLVDRSGIVQTVHVGYRPDIGEKLKEELDGLLAGKDLAAEHLKAEEAKD